MREIKFRCYSEQDKIMYQPLALEVIAQLGHNFSDNIKIMQYTGLKDKNGVEIYEGDIVEFNNKKMIVVYQAPSFVMKLKINSKKWTTFILAPCENQLETVIGNIYENKELLK